MTTALPVQVFSANCRGSLRQELVLAECYSDGCWGDLCETLIPFGCICILQQAVIPSAVLPFSPADFAFDWRQHSQPCLQVSAGMHRTGGTISYSEPIHDGHVFPPLSQDELVWCSWRKEEEEGVISNEGEGVPWSVAGKGMNSKR